MIIGITGGTGCGKTTVLDVITELGGKVFDCDAIYHELLVTDRELLNRIHKRFPGTVVDGSLRRKVLGEIVFHDSDALKDLNEITHQAVYQAVVKELEGYQGLAAIDAIALFESGLDKLCEFTIAVTAPEEVRVKRLMARDHISEDYARSRIAAQKSADYFTKNCTYTLENDADMATFRSKCLVFFREHCIMENNTK